jgi:hypothetical protein
MLPRLFEMLTVDNSMPFFNRHRDFFGLEYVGIIIVRNAIITLIFGGSSFVIYTT